MRKLAATLCLTLAVLLGSTTGCQQSSDSEAYHKGWNKADFQKGLDAYHTGHYTTAVRELNPIAEQGNASAQSMLGWMYDEGLGVPKNYRIALYWYRLAAEQRHADAQNNLGRMYENGRGVPPDYKTAVKWYRLAAEGGFANAQYKVEYLKLKIAEAKASSPTQRHPRQSPSNMPLDKAEKKCAEIGFTKGTEKYGDCVMKLLN